MTRKLLVAAAVLIASGSSASFGATWSSSGPAGGVVQAIAADPVTGFVVYAGLDEGGIFKSDPTADPFWHAMNTGLADLGVRAIAVSPSSPDVVLAGTGTGVYRSTNGAASWALAGGPPPAPIDAIAFDRTAPTNVYAVSFTGWVGKSTDGGANWQALGGEPTTQRPQAVHVDPTNGSVVYVGTIDGGVFKSENGGTTWTAQNLGLNNLHVSAIAVDPTAPSTVYLGTDNGGAYYSTDGGANWAAMAGGLLGTDVDAIVVNATGRAFLLNHNGLFGSLDGGLGWAIIAQVPYGNALSLGPGDPATLWVGYGQLPQAAGGVGYYTTPGPFQFGPFDGLNGSTISSIAVDPASPAVVLACTPVGTVRSEDGGASWQATNAPPLGLSVIYETQSVAYQGYVAGVAKSADSGEVWTLANAGLPANSLVRALLVLPGAAGHVLSGTAAGVYRTTDGGLNWAAPGTAVPTTVYSLARDPSSSTVWAGASDGVYRSTDGGVTWSLAGSATASPVHAVLDSAVAPGKTYAGTDAGLLVSTNDGSSWTPVAGGLPAGAVFALVEDPARSAIYAGGDAGVFQSTDGGVTWASAGDGLTNPHVLSLAVQPNGTLLAGTRGGSVFRRVEATTVPRDPVARSDGRGETRDVPPRP